MEAAHLAALITLADSSNPSNKREAIVATEHVLDPVIMSTAN